MASRKLEVEIIGDSRSLERAFGRSSKAGSDFGHKLGTAAKGAAIGIGALAVAGGFLGKKMISLASDAGEVESKFKIIFGKEMPKMIKNLDEFSRATGASRFELREQVADMGALLEPLTANKKAAGELSIQFTKLATDLGSFNNVPTADALLAIRSGLVGESEPLRRFGVLLNEAAVKAEALRLGLVKGKEELTEQQKVQARASLIMQQTTLAQGDAERTAGSFANQIKALKNGLADMGTELGIVLLPHMLRLVTFINENMPTIKTVMEATIKGVIAVIDFLVPPITKIIDWFKLLAIKAREHWGEVQAAIKATTDWYRANVLPTFESVSRNVLRAWDKMGSDLQTSAKSNLSRLPPLFSAQLGNMGSVITGALALIRGDWSKAWHEFGEIPKRTFMMLVNTIKILATTLYQAAVRVGQAIVDGIRAGISAAWDGLTSWIGEKMADLKNAITHPWRIFSPSKVTIDIGKQIAEGLGVGFGLGMVTVQQQVADKISATIDAMIRAVGEKRSAFGAAFSTLASEALAAFDKLAAEVETQMEKRIRKQDEARAKAERADALRAAKADVQAAIGAGMALTQGEGESAADFAARQEAAGQEIIAAQKRQDEAEFAIQRAKDEKIAAAQRKALDDKTALRRRHFEEELAALEAQATRLGLSATAMNNRLLAIFKSYGVPFKNSANALGLALAEGLRDAMGDVENAANALRKAITDGLQNIRVVATVQVTGKMPQTPGLQHGGPVKAGSPYIVGEAGPELLIPNTTGRILPNTRRGGLAMAGGVTIVVNAPNYVGDKKDLSDAMQDVVLSWQRRNGGSFFG